MMPSSLLSRIQGDFPMKLILSAPVGTRVHYFIRKSEDPKKSINTALILHESFLFYIHIIKGLVDCQAN